MICTGKRDWTSRIEDDGEGTGWGKLGRKLRFMLTRGGEFADVGRLRLRNLVSSTVMS